MNETLILDKAHTVHLKAGGEVCNRLARGTRVMAVQARGDWVKINWRNGKKKGWIHLPKGS